VDETGPRTPPGLNFAEDPLPGPARERGLALASSEETFLPFEKQLCPGFSVPTRRRGKRHRPKGPVRQVCSLSVLGDGKWLRKLLLGKGGGKRGRRVRSKSIHSNIVLSTTETADQMTSEDAREVPQPAAPPSDKKRRRRVLQAYGRKEEEAAVDPEELLVQMRCMEELGQWSHLPTTRRAPASADARLTAAGVRLLAGEVEEAGGLAGRGEATSCGLAGRGEAATCRPARRGEPAARRLAGRDWAVVSDQQVAI
jgi:hypothetical protein